MSRGEAFKFMDAADDGGHGQLLVQRVSYTGDLGYEIFCDHMKSATCGIRAVGRRQDLGLRPFGMRAMMSLRLDKWFGSWGREFSPTTPRRNRPRPLHPLEQARRLDRQGRRTEGKGRRAEAQAGAPS
jgi:glycine cleavage system aminomethyltransferase T